ncbi:hypothetical protein OFR22_13900 [Brachyspira hyodysenteriae]|uniref:hypothetical protein n=4 Tax=Brachyspira hyodysenteriae TaxID=159 RepID=UPI0021B277DB|nr:hypothetical protein [Brachyspira hyodysenteriae]MCZ9838861.1 hypothetical protein [Brachyspira hyodysenteriae]MCZ9848149.1 hypothetical protein [Brachyspira hyodysenteriae]MCZ9851803.1 hypothetical protein [Brachyspira hyodysenteriae]MCZ9859459.1 hypothetical protein [Brachyspira hyodysenteriae]MCZ9870062.1 hypothetical protein [Brachyspira hyodysenteriae]
MNKKLVDKIVWYIPFKNLRNDIRNFLVSLETNIRLPILMTEDERELFVKSISESKEYLEFGSGGSTFIVLKTTNANIISIESDINWINHMRDNKTIFEEEQFCRLKFVHIDIGEISIMGMPKDKSKLESYPKYSEEIFKILDKNHINKIDTVLIDGRFRVACVLNTILNCNKNIKIIIHDFFNREEYHILLNYLDTIEKSNSLGVFKIKENINTDEINKLIEKYKYNPR